jgi:hypothetical protein
VKKQVVIVAAATAVVVCCALQIAVSARGAAPRHGALVFGPGDQCWLLNGDGFNISGTTVHGVVNAGKNSNLTCVGSGPNNTGGPVHFSFENTGYPCEVYNVNGAPGPDSLTYDWEENVTPNGNAHLTCHLHVGKTL